MKLRALLAGLVALATAGNADAANKPYWRGGAEGLAYMADESDFSAIDLRCERGVVVISTPSPDDNVDDFIFAGVQLRSGKQAGRYRAKVVQGDLETRFEFKTTAQDPVMKAFRHTGLIVVRGGPELIAVTKAERARIDRFFAACGRTVTPSP